MSKGPQTFQPRPKQMVFPDQAWDERPRHGNSTSIPFSDFSYAYSLKCAGVIQKKSERSMSIHRGALPPAHSYLFLFHYENEMHMNLKFALFFLQELSACLSEFILAKPPVIRKYCDWSHFPTTCL